MLELRNRINVSLGKESKISVTDLLVKITAKALEMRPGINVSLNGNVVKKLKDINIGVAVALENGLLVPVIKNVDKKDLTQISKELKDLTEKAKNRKIGIEEMSGGTFTISNLGGFKSVDFFTPIINQPESAILGVGRTVETPIVIDGKIVIRPLMGLSLAFDHRVIDGAPAAEFLAVLLHLIANPDEVISIKGGVL